MDGGAARGAGGEDAGAQAVGAFDRAADGGGQSAIEPECDG